MHCLPAGRHIDQATDDILPRSNEEMMSSTKEASTPLLVVVLRRRPHSHRSARATTRQVTTKAKEKKGPLARGRRLHDLLLQLHFPDLCLRADRQLLRRMDGVVAPPRRRAGDTGYPPRDLNYSLPCATSPRPRTRALMRRRFDLQRATAPLSFESRSLSRK